MPTWVTGLLLLACTVGLVAAFFVARRKGLARFHNSMQEARAEGAAELRAQLGQHVQVNVGNVSHGQSPSPSDSPTSLGELSHDPAHVPTDLASALGHAVEHGGRVYALDGAVARRIYPDDPEYAAALSRALDHDDESHGYDPVLYPPAHAADGSDDDGGQRGSGAADHFAVARRVRSGHRPPPRDVNGRGPGR